jgi:hypothetical protein
LTSSITDERTLTESEDMLVEGPWLVKRIKTGHVAKSMKIFSDPRKIKAILNPLAWRIMLSLDSKEKYPAQMARELHAYRQKIYYYTRRLESAGFIKQVKEQEVSGGLARLYTASSYAFGIELPGGEQLLPNIVPHDILRTSFWQPLIREGVFDAKIVVGSPEPHGPLRTSARDGHYAVHLALFLGKFCNFPSHFTVKLDVDVKTEKEEGSNMILVGGPATNLLSADVNSNLPIRFDEKNYWGGLVAENGERYNLERDGIIAKIRNPFDPSKSLIVLAGNRHIGTKAAILAVTQYWKVALANYRGEETWAVAIRGFDLDADGKVDSVEVIS